MDYFIHNEIKIDCFEHCSNEINDPSLPVIPAEVNGVWMVCFWGPFIHPPALVFGSLRGSQ